MQVRQVAQRLGKNTEKLPTEYPIKQLLAIYTERIAILLAGAFLSALMLVCILFIVKTPSFSILITVVLLLLIGVWGLVSPSKSSLASLPYSVKDGEFEKIRRHLDDASKTGRQTRMNTRNEILKAEIDILEYSLHQLHYAEASLNSLFSRMMKSGDYDYPEILPPFAIRKDISMARMCFYAAAACIIGESLLAGWLSVQMGFPFWYGILPSVLIVTIFQGIISIVFGAIDRPRLVFQRIKMLIFVPSSLLFALSFIFLLISRVASGELAFKLLPISNFSLWVVTLVLPIMAAAFLMLGQEMSWSKKAEQEYIALQREQLKIKTLIQRLDSELKASQSMVETSTSERPLAR